MPIAAVHRGEVLSQEFEELFLEHSHLVYRTAYAITGRRQDAEDVLQSVFLTLLQRRLTLDVLRQPARYLHRAAVNHSLNALRTRKRRKLSDGIDLLEIPDARGRDDARGDPRHERLREAMAGLTPRALEILLLHYQDDCSHAEIASRLGTSRGVIAVTLHRIRARLRRLLRPTFAEASAGKSAGSEGEDT